MSGGQNLNADPFISRITASRQHRINPKRHVSLSLSLSTFLPLDDNRTFILILLIDVLRQLSFQQETGLHTV